MNLITSIVEPQKLDFIWKSSGEPSTHFKVGEIVRNNEQYFLKYLTLSEDFLAAQKVGFVGYPGFKISTCEYTENVIETFRKRIPARSRLDFRDYLLSHNIAADAQISEFALLGYSGGKLPSDSF